MELENKIMQLYNEINEPVKARKIVTLLKLVLVDKVIDMAVIKEATYMGPETIKKYTSDKNEMLKYLTEQELDLFLSKLNPMFEKSNKKLQRLINLVLVEGESDIDRLQELIPITFDTLKKYVKEKDELLKYLTEEQLEKFLNTINPIPQNLNRKLQRLIRLVLAEGETDINKIQSSVPITITTIKKYANDRKELLNYLKEEQIEEFVKKVIDMVTLEEKKVELDKLKSLRNIIDDIFHTRYRLEDICSKNFMQMKTVVDYFNDKNYIDKNFGEGTLERVKAKIVQNGSDRSKVPRDCFIIEARVNIYIARDDLLYLNQFDNKRLNFAASYLGSGANLEFVIRKNETNSLVALSILSDSKLKQILKPEHYEDLEKYIKIEKILVENNVEEKQKMMFTIINFLEQNNFDNGHAIEYFKLPEHLLNKILLESLKLPYVNDETKNELKKLLNIEGIKKVK